MSKKTIILIAGTIVIILLIILLILSRSTKQNDTLSRDSDVTVPILATNGPAATNANSQTETKGALASLIDDLSNPTATPIPTPTAIAATVAIPAATTNLDEGDGPLTAAELAEEDDPYLDNYNEEDSELCAEAIFAFYKMLSSAINKNNWQLVAYYLEPNSNAWNSQRAFYDEQVNRGNQAYNARVEIADQVMAVDGCQAYVKVNFSTEKTLYNWQKLVFARPSGGVYLIFDITDPPTE